MMRKQWIPGPSHKKGLGTRLMTIMNHQHRYIFISSHIIAVCDIFPIVGVIEGLKAFANLGFVEMKLHIDECGPSGNDMIYERGHTQWVPEDGVIVYNK